MPPGVTVIPLQILRNLGDVMKPINAHRSRRPLLRTARLALLGATSLALVTRLLMVLETLPGGLWLPALLPRNGVSLPTEARND